jgi:anthranilate phosphoribosyltransferase
MIKQVISKLVDRQDLTESEMIYAMDIIMTGKASEAQIGSFLTALRIKGETVDEITGAAKVMRTKALSVNPGKGQVVDTCGTGGDGTNTFNISTTAAFVASGAGLTVAKHGNKAVSSACGSADVLRELGVNIDVKIDTVEMCLQEAGVGFLFAPLMHSAMKHAIGPRREVGIRTIFNILGPLTNPAGVQTQIIGVYDKSLTEQLANVLCKLGSRRVMVVHGNDGLDEITVTGSTHVSLCEKGTVKTFELNPEQFGIPTYDINEIKGLDSKANAAITRSVLGGEKGARRDITLLNAGAAIYVGKELDTIQDGIEKAKESIDSGAAKDKLIKLIELTNK